MIVLTSRRLTKASFERKLVPSVLAEGEEALSVCQAPGRAHQASCCEKTLASSASQSQTWQVNWLDFSVTTLEEVRGTLIV